MECRSYYSFYLYTLSDRAGRRSGAAHATGEEPSFFPAMSYPENMSSPDLTRKGTSDDMAVSPAGATAHDHDTPNFKRTLFKSSPLQSGTTDSTIDKNCTPSTDDKNKNLMDNSHMQLADNEQMGDVRKQLRFSEEARASANARKDNSHMRMIEMMRMEMEVRRQMAELAEKHTRQMDEMKMLTTQMAQKAEWMKTIIGQQQTILEQQQTTLEQLQTIFELVARMNDLVCRRLQQRYKEEQEQEQEQEEQDLQEYQRQQEENKGKEQQEQQEEGEEQQEEQQQHQQQAAATALAGSSTGRQQQQQAVAEQDQQERRVQIDVKRLSARADRRQAALQRQERERAEQQWFAVTANISTTFTASAITARAVASAAVVITAVAITAIACAPIVISTAVTPAIFNAFTAFAIAAIATAILTAITSSTSRQQQQQAVAEQEQRDQQEHRVQIDVKRLSARADRRQAALQRQEREREDQQWFEQLRNREPKASEKKRTALRYLTREIRTVVFR